MQKTILFLLFSFSILISNFAQINGSVGRIDVLADSRIENLVDLEKSIDEITGYRLQICFDSDKKVIDEARDRFLKSYPLIATYVEFEAPHFNLKVGDFRTRLEAEKLKREVFGDFVICIIHEDLIQLPRID
tara:strand:+ start:4409 stop:4804 length:396 start_codon:yes stop_codon:yes gene_type:complete